MPLAKRAWDVMDSNFETVTPETLLKEACAILIGHGPEKAGIPGLVVMRSSGEYLGLLTTKDVLKYMTHLYKRSKEQGGEDWLTQLRYKCVDESLITVNDVLIRYEIYVRPSQKLHEVVRTMADHNLEMIPVADVGKILGVIRSTDILAEIARSIYPSKGHSI